MPIFHGNLKSFQYFSTTELLWNNPYYQYWEGETKTFKASLVYIESSKLAKGAQRDLVSKYKIK